MNAPLPMLNLYKALSDECRLRMLRALYQAELSVAELVRVMGLPQSTVSRHLKPLRETGLLETRREGTSVYYHRGPAFSDTDIAQVIDRSLQELPGAAEDRASVRLILDGRSSRNRLFFDELAGRYGSLTEPGGGWQGMASALALGFQGKSIADVGAGEGVLSLMLARAGAQVIAVDVSPKMLMTLREAAEVENLSDRVLTREGDLQALPLAEKEVDAVFISQALHHAAEPERAIAEAMRVLRPGGRLVILDLLAHEQEWVREEYADLWLGFDPARLADMLREAGFEHINASTLPGATPELPVLFLTALKPQS